MKVTHRIVVGKDIHKFSVAHMTVFPDGSKENLHGHNYYVNLGVDLARVDFASFVDFAGVKKALAEQCRKWDERLLVAERCPFLEIVQRESSETEFVLCGKRYVIPSDECLFLPVENISTEILAEEFVRGLASGWDLSKNKGVVTGLEVTVTETQGQSGVARLEF